MHKALIYYYHYIALKSLNITFKKTSLFSKLIPIVLIIKKIIIIINDFLIHFFKGSTGECELAVVSSPPVSRKPHYAKEVSSDQLLNLRYILCLHFICLHFWIVYILFCLHFQRSVRSWQSLSRSATHSRGTITSSSFATNLGFCS